MKAKNESSPFISLAKETKETKDNPLFRQIYESIRTAILCGQIVAKTKLPSTRELSKNLDVSRITVVNAYAQLLAEGYLEGKIGSGTFVAEELPENLLNIAQVKKNKKIDETGGKQIKVSNFARRLSEKTSESRKIQTVEKAVPFKNGLTAVNEFPFDIWEKIAVRVYRQARFNISGYDEAAGFRPLREAAAKHLAATRGVHCEIDRIFITNGAQQALDLIGKILLESGEKILIEDPCYQEARDVFHSYGAQIIPVAVDAEGFNLENVRQPQNNAKLVYITPSHQYPTGVTMSLARRLHLLEWARKNDAWIIEDDYNSEFRYAGRPLASLQNLDDFGRVIYIGTFSKTIFPALRLGCLVVPKSLVNFFAEARNLCDSHSTIFEQMILADFIAEGHFARHLRRMRLLYEKRQIFLINEIEKELGDRLKVSKTPSGMHLVAQLAEGFNETAISEKAFTKGLHLSPLSNYCIKNKLPAGFVLGYTGFDEKQIKQGVKILKEILSS